MGAGIAVLALHAGVAGAIFSSSEPNLDLPENEAIMVSVVEAPQPQLARGEPVPEPPQPQAPQPEPPPPVKTPPPEPEVAEPEPEPPVAEPEPEPEPVVEKAPEPAPKPKPKPKPKPVAKAPPKAQTPPRPVAPPPPPPPQVAGTPEGSTPQAPRQGPPRDQPELVSNIEYIGRGPSPVYPRASMREREEGRVMVLVVINPQGAIERARVVASSGYPRLDEAALDALQRVRFKPYTRNGVALTVQARIPFDFNLRK